MNNTWLKFYLQLGFVLMDGWQAITNNVSRQTKGKENSNKGEKNIQQNVIQLTFLANAWN